jgi:hypothetical protein
MYIISISNITYPLVIAPKPNSPQGCRFCGDYTIVNTFMPFRQAYVPNVLYELNKAARGKFFINFDMPTAFHQIVLEEVTSNNLSILTSWGNIRPLFMPEGISSASGILNSIMTEIFEPESKYTIVIFDNFLVITQLFRDCYEKLVRFLTICAERNVILGMAKSKIGYSHVLRLPRQGEHLFYDRVTKEVGYFPCYAYNPQTGTVLLRCYCILLQ